MHIDWRTEETWRAGVEAVESHSKIVAVLDTLRKEWLAELTTIAPDYPWEISESVIEKSFDYFIIPPRLEFSFPQISPDIPASDFGNENTFVQPTDTITSFEEVVEISENLSIRVNLLVVVKLTEEDRTALRACGALTTETSTNITTNEVVACRI